MVSLLRVFCLTALVALALSSKTHKDCINTNFLRVFGAGKATYKHTIAVVKLGIQVRTKTPAQAQNQLSFTITKLVRFLKAAEANKVQPSSMSVISAHGSGGPPTGPPSRGPHGPYPPRGPPRPPARQLLTSSISKMQTVSRQQRYIPGAIPPGARGAPPRGYIGRVMVSFETSIEDAGKIVRASANYGATQVASINFKATEHDANAARVAAIADAVSSARREAEAGAETSEKEIVRTLSVSISNVFMPRPKPAGWGIRRGMHPGMAPSTALVNSVQKIGAFVSVAFMAEDLYEWE